MLDEMEKIKKSNEEWKQQLSHQQYQVAREKGTERAFSGKYCDMHEQGVYKCVCCGKPLFESDTKFDSGTGWPSFYAPVSGDAVETEEDTAHGMRRIEVVCSGCNAHLGHVFRDGPRPTGLRYCMNSASRILSRKASRSGDSQVRVDSAWLGWGLGWFRS